MTYPRAVYAGPPGVDWERLWRAACWAFKWGLRIGVLFILAHVICALMTGSMG